VTTLIRGRSVLTSGPAGALRDAAVRVDGGTIAEVGPWERLMSAHPEAEVVGDGTGVVLPGLVNAHGHFSEALVTGMGESLTLFEWIQHLVAPVGPHLTRRMAEVGTLLRGAEMLASGVTTVNDLFVCSPHPEAPVTPGVVDGLERLGLRGEVAFGAQDRNDPRSVEEIFAEHDALEAAAAGSRRCRFRMGLATVLAQSDALFAASVRRAHESGCRVHTHFHEVREEVVASRQLHGLTTIGYAAREGLFDVEVLAAHCIWLSDADVEILAAHDVRVAHNPIANMILASGVCPVRRLQAAGIPVGIGTDGPGSNDGQDMLEAVKVAALLQKVDRLDPTAMTAPEVLRMATIDGARALGLHDVTGSLEPGKEADVVLLDGRTPALAVTHDPYQAVAYCTTSRAVSDVWIQGERVLVAGRPTRIDLDAVIDEARELAAELVSEAGLRNHPLLFTPETVARPAGA
jgi:cytosine/adenosine deaminase-related metal-dependent hydrolase